VEESINHCSENISNLVVKLTELFKSD
jgi:hypothetical protein